MKTETKTFELRLIPLEIHAEIRRQAFAENTSINKWILKAIEEKLERTAKD